MILGACVLLAALGQSAVPAGNAESASIAEYARKAGRRISNGRYAIIEGDILVDLSSAAKLGRGVGNTWADGRVPFDFRDGMSARVRSLTNEATARISRETPLRFLESDNFVGLPHITIVYNEEIAPACGASQVGRLPDGQELQLNPSCVDNLAYSDDDVRGVIIHELLHALGMLHEQQRSDRDAYVSVPAGNDQCRLRVSANLTPYDFHSIMHYPASTCGGMRALMAQPPGPPNGPAGRIGLPACSTATQCTSAMGIGTELSVRDVAGLWRVYGVPIRARITAIGASVSLGIAGDEYSCGANCWAVRLGASASIAALSSDGGIVFIRNGPCLAHGCTFSPSDERLDLAKEFDVFVTTYGILGPIVVALNSDGDVVMANSFE